MQASILVTGAGFVALWSVATNQAWPSGSFMAAKGWEQPFIRSMCNDRSDREQTLSESPWGMESRRCCTQGHGRRTDLGDRSWHGVGRPSGRHLQALRMPPTPSVRSIRTAWAFRRQG